MQLSGNSQPATLVSAGFGTLRFAIAPVSFAVGSSNPAVGVITNSPRTKAGNQSCINQNAGGQFQFDPLAAGTTNLNLTQPAGFATPANLAQSIVATVN